MEKLFDKLPYEDLESIKAAHLLAGSIGIGLVLLLVYYLTLYSSTNEEFKKLTTQKEGTERTLKEYKATLIKEGLVKKNMTLVRSRFDVFKNQMPSQNEISTLMQRLAVFGKHRNIKITAITMEEGAVKDFYKEIPFKIQITGELWDTVDFIEYAQNLLRLVSFENLKLQGRRASSSDLASSRAAKGSLNTTLTAKIFTFLEDSEDRSGQKKHHLVQRRQ